VLPLEDSPELPDDWPVLPLEDSPELPDDWPVLPLEDSPELPSDVCDVALVSRTGEGRSVGANKAAPQITNPITQRADPTARRVFVGGFRWRAGRSGRVVCFEDTEPSVFRFADEASRSGTSTPRWAGRCENLNVTTDASR
jgi:hypothetical protein